jgi:YtkA-like
VRRLPLLLVPLALLVAAPSAHAGGWATVGLSSTPAGTPPGQPWDVDITVLQHGRTPLEGVTPTVHISSGDTTKTFVAEPTGEPGVYRARVVFPKAGSWNYEVHDGFISDFAHTFPAVEIGDGAGSPAVPAADTSAPAPAPAPDDGGIAAGWLWGAGAALVLALAVLGFDRRRRGQGAVPGSPEPAA